MGCLERFSELIVEPHKKGTDEMSLQQGEDAMQKLPSAERS